MTSLNLNKILNNEDRLRELSNHAFESVDENGDGRIDVEELQKCLNTITKDLNIDMPSKEDVEQIMKNLDQDNDNELDKKEFKELMRLWLQMKIKQEKK